MRKILITILAIVLIAAIALSGYIFFKNSKTEEKSEPQEEQQLPEEPEPIIDYGYLEIGEWGIASKYSSKSEEYENVNVTVKQMLRGQEAEQIVKEFTQNNTYFAYEEPQEGMEWLVIEYQINFGDFTKGNNGANSDIQTKIKGYGENEDIVVNNKIYETTTQDISTREYTNAEQTTGKFATQIPIECEQYVILFGNEQYNYCEFEGIPKEAEQTEENVLTENIE